MSTVLGRCASDFNDSTNVGTARAMFDVRPRRRYIDIDMNCYSITTAQKGFPHNEATAHPKHRHLQTKRSRLASPVRRRRPCENNAPRSVWTRAFVLYERVNESEITCAARVWEIDCLRNTCTAHGNANRTSRARFSLNPAMCAHNAPHLANEPFCVHARLRL